MVVSNVPRVGEVVVHLLVEDVELDIQEVPNTEVEAGLQTGVLFEKGSHRVPAPKERRVSRAEVKNSGS